MVVGVNCVSLDLFSLLGVLPPALVKRNERQGKKLREERTDHARWNWSKTSKTSLALWKKGPTSLSGLSVEWIQARGRVVILMWETVSPRAHTAFLNYISRWGRCFKVTIIHIRWLYEHRELLSPAILFSLLLNVVVTALAASLSDICTTDKH